MGIRSFFQNLFGGTRSIQQSPFDSLGQWIGWNSYSSIYPRNALMNSAVWSCVNLIIGQIQSLPLIVIDKDSEGENTIIPVNGTKAFLPYILRVKPNAAQTPNQVIGKLLHDLVFHGNAFLMKVKNFAGEVIQLLPIDANLVSIQNPTAENGYLKTYLFGGNCLDDDTIIHFMRFSQDGFRGASILIYLQGLFSALGAQEDFAHLFWKVGAQPGGVITQTVQDKLTPEQRKQIQKEFENQYAGKNNVGKTMVLNYGQDYKQLNFNAKEAQLLESRTFAIEEVARVFGIPLAKLGLGPKENGVSLEIQNQIFLNDCLGPWINCIQEGLTLGLIPDALQGIRAIHFDVSKLNSIDYKTKVDSIVSLTNSGLMKVNEARHELNLPHVQGGDSLIFAQHQAMLGSDGNLIKLNEPDNQNSQQNEDLQNE